MVDAGFIIKHKLLYMSNTKAKKKFKFTWDGVGMALSGICILHCILLPVFLIGFPAITGFIPISEDLTHTILLLFLLPTALFAVYSGYKMHQQKKPLILMMIGLIIVLIGTLFLHEFVDHHWEPIVVTIGSLIIVRAHFLNRHHCKRCEHDEQDCIW